MVINPLSPNAERTHLSPTTRLSVGIGSTRRRSSSAAIAQSKIRCITCLLRVACIAAIVGTASVAMPATTQGTQGATPGGPSGSGPAWGTPGSANQPVGNWWDRTAPPPGGGLPTSRSYTVRSDLSLEKTRELADHLDTMFVEYSRRLASLPQRMPHVLNVFMFERRQDYVDTLRTQFGIDAAGSGGMFFVTPRGSGLAFFVDGVPRTRVLHVIQHEGFHQFAFSRFAGDLPIWANEGLAEFFGFAAVIGREVVIGQASPWTLAALRDAVERDATIPFLEMLTMTNEGWNARVRTRQASLQYQQAWSMVHFLVFADRGRYREPFERYLRLLNAGMPSEPAFIQAFQTNDLDAFERRWKRYVMEEATPGAFVAAFERLEFLIEGMLELERQGRHPETLEELRDALIEIEFRHRIERHGYAVELRADDPTVYTIPEDEQARQPPTFVVERRRPPRGVRERREEEARPSPAPIRTQNLRPRELAVRWIRTEDGFRYELETR